MIRRRANRRYSDHFCVGGFGGILEPRPELSGGGLAGWTNRLPIRFNPWSADRSSARQFPRSFEVMFVIAKRSAMNCFRFFSERWNVLLVGRRCCLGSMESKESEESGYKVAR